MEISMPLGRLLQKLEDEGHEPSRPHVEAQKMELLDRWRAYNDRQTLVPGDLVQEKRGLGQLKVRSQQTVVMMLWRMLDTADRIDASIADDWISRFKINRIDCIVAFQSDDGTHLEFMPHELAQLEMFAP